MFFGRAIAWTFAIFMIALPIHWIWFGLVDGGVIRQEGSITHLLVRILIFWSIAGVLIYYLRVSAPQAMIRMALKRKELADLRAREEQEYQALLAAPLTEIQTSKAILKAGEKAYGAVMASWQEERTVGFSAGTKGVSVRVAKGVTLRSSGTRGHAVKEVVGVSTGELVITNKRVIFSGDQKSFAIPLTSLLGTTHYSDGFGFSDNKRAYALKTHNKRDWTLFAVALNKVVRGQSAGICK
jgi:hypothetical protein